ncbi:uncharacterized protein F4817DRAFT_247291 [Daldinia loculata]|uniref:uncharacterized protein n=1 Tax=Daldinia loculata TaxID=103429 RepID=UPI0020C49625|nr:uncharacterized protein F4817DRAFT_247291 [Daldinia loculata]KAI1643690.1 hypothetical protein F4817DRAFT_247291 [Daldinia loculata]
MCKDSIPILVYLGATWLEVSGLGAMSPHVRFYYVFDQGSLLFRCQETFRPYEAEVELDRYLRISYGRIRNVQHVWWIG